MGKKLKLQNLKIKSFVTALNKDQAKLLKGGLGNISFDPDASNACSECPC